MSRKTPSQIGVCAENPELWQDRRRQTTAARKCLRCPVLEGCRTAALREEPTYGVWAGIWIDGDFTTKRHLFTAAATARPTSVNSSETVVVQHNLNVATLPTIRRPRRVGPLSCGALAPAATELITARASGHCEIMAPACLYQQHAIYSRHGSTPHPNQSPADGIAVCHNCLELIEATDRATARRLGYLATARLDPARIEVYWRQQHWVLLDHFGQLLAASLPHTLRRATTSRSA